MATCTGPPRWSPRADPAGVRRGVGVAVADGRVLAIEREATLRRRYPEAEVVDCGGGVLVPGWVDSHTHAVFGRWRVDEFVLRTQGVGYAEILRRGGGILASMEDVRARSEDELVACARPRLQALLAWGTTTAEVKSGYGLRWEDERKMLRAIARLDAELPLDLVPTFLGAHAVPPEFADRPDAYVDLVIEAMLPAVAAEGLARFCDVFVEPGAFTPAQGRRILEAARRWGLALKLHADEFAPSGGAELAAELGAVSADHLGAISAAGIQALARAGVVATLLPLTLFALGHRHYAPARALLDAGVEIALATDFNPGTAPSPSMPLVLATACAQMGLHPREAIRAATAGGAAALRLNDGRGTLRPGAPADLVLWPVDRVDALPYHLGSVLPRGVWKRGVPVAGEWLSAFGSCSSFGD